MCNLCEVRWSSCTQVPPGYTLGDLYDNDTVTNVLVLAVCTVVIPYSFHLSVQ